MKMKNMFAVLGLATAVILTSCGGGNKKAEDEAARKKREADSLAKIEQAKQDSLAKLNQAPELVNVVETAKKDANLSTLVELVSAAGLVDRLADANANYTIFAPTNEAFAKIKDLEDLKTNVKRKQELADIVSYHVVSGKFGSGDLKEGNELDALDEKVIAVTMKDGALAVGGAKVTTADVQASNGVIHIVDNVMTPPKKKSKSKNPPVTTTTTTATTTTTTVSTSTGTTNTTVTGRGNTGTTTVTGRGNTSTTGTSTSTVTGRGNK